jgi:hypothetical protein
MVSVLDFDSRMHSEKPAVFGVHAKLESAIYWQK